MVHGRTAACFPLMADILQVYPGGICWDLCCPELLLLSCSRPGCVASAQEFRQADQQSFAFGTCWDGCLLLIASIQMPGDAESFLERGKLHAVLTKLCAAPLLSKFHIMSFAYSTCHFLMLRSSPSARLTFIVSP